MSAAEDVKPPRFRLVSYEDVKLDTAAPWLVKGLVRRDGLTVVWGPPKCGKSFWTYDLVMHIALGWPYRGKRVVKGPVVYVAAEGATGLQARIEAWRQERTDSYEHFVPFWLLPSQLSLIDEWVELVSAIREAVSVIPPAVIVIDTLNRTLVGSENSDEDMAGYIRSADSLRECFGCAVIVVHHCGHDGTRPRGHTSLIGALDCQIAVKKSADGLITTEVEKMKDGVEGDTTVSRLKVVEVGQDEDGDPITSCVVEPADDEAPKTTAPKVTGQARIALDLLRKAIADAGKPAPQGRHYPGTSTVVSVSLWRDYCRTGGLAAGDNADAFKKAFQRARDKLKSQGVIGIWSDHVWIVSSEGDKGT